ncbi:hypothetical protein JAAARDRAFT_147414 [Jaapia argillacea MUCL 33604]|uniref:RFX-type winged-helix domain-containing protein n=1 Tax=Jaapia argillacea MUCL 33604 TaxID=933084 RepID=A0A067Q8F9_9AGAM|nr:hypothetical protein JAAARDRAFT_147414 [Jaapia argillacea MUCL 33604]
MQPSAYRPPTYVDTQASQPQAPTTTDDYERWYTDRDIPTNRMVLSLRSGLDPEISWALDRLCRLCDNDQFLLDSMPGLTDALFEWPEWYIGQSNSQKVASPLLFALPPDVEAKKRHGLECLFILRNSSLNEPNAIELAQHRRTLPLILLALRKVKPDSDANTEFLLHAIELLQTISPDLVLASSSSPEVNPVQILAEIAGTSSNRSLIISCLSTLNILLSNPSNVAHHMSDSKALTGALRYLPLFVDHPLVDACVNFLYTHLSHYPTAKAFLLHPDMPSTLKVLVSLLLHEQVEETVSLDIGSDVYTVPANSKSRKNHELTREELDSLVAMPEPQRCYEWMKAMFIAEPDGELTQVDFWTLYKDVFSPFQDRFPLLVASEVIKNVNLIFPSAQAMVLPGPPQKFVVRGVDRRREDSVNERFRCHWDRSQCALPPFSSPDELFEHIVSHHILNYEGSEMPCFWATCPIPPLPKGRLRSHILTHIPSSQPSPLHPSQSDTITLPNHMFPYPTSNPTTRPLPPARESNLTYRKAAVDPPSTSLTALLCIRILFRASFASADAAPRVDKDHFGFPGVVEEVIEQEADVPPVGIQESEQEGEKRGRRAFTRVRKMLQEVQIRGQTFTGWILEMVDAGLTGTT